MLATFSLKKSLEICSIGRQSIFRGTQKLLGWEAVFKGLNISYTVSSDQTGPQTEFFKCTFIGSTSIDIIDSIS